MPAIHRKGDSCTGHDTYPPRNNVGGSGDVFINGIPVHRVGDAWPPHCSVVPDHPCHAGSAASGSATVFANGRPLCRIGDAVDCGSAMASGSPDVFSN
ncbi:PAAR domain-containing protein [Vibrio sonorensis]|uniref:PAAR domain-containing protein n=1 Tax=Vibrio sonorensis TaxID=1004316 RepID=UPI0008D9836A|nr:PAAR domain-containing protein [Vibrio sonorensis]